MRTRCAGGKEPGLFVITGTVIAAAILLLTSLTPVMGAVAPEREIIPLDDPKMPLWKSNWDAGRAAARNGDLVSASRFYKELIAEKPQIEAAKWEYCKILFSLREYDQLPVLLQSLIESNFHNQDYFEMAGFVSLKKKEYPQAVSYLGQVYSSNPEGARGTKLLAGLVNGLLGLGKDASALPLMEQLLQRTPGDSALIKSIAETSYRVGQSEKAKEYYQLLISIAEVTDSLLREASSVIMAAGDDDGAAEIWQKIVSRDPQAIEYHRRLYRYYISKELPEKALPHIMKVVENGVEEEPELLLIAGRLYFYDAGRADKALRLFERYLLSMPEHHEIKKEINAVREKIATDLLSIVENDGAETLWQDLDRITNDRLILFHLMADKLEKAKKTAAAIDVLKIIYSQTGTDNTALRLARLYSMQGDKAQSYSYYKRVKERPNLTFKYYRKKLAFENLLGLDREALKTYKKILAIKPDAISFRKRGLVLAGQLGLAKDIEKLAHPVLLEKYKKEHFEFYLTYGNSLQRSGQYGKAESFYKSLLKEQWLSESESERVFLGFAELYKKMEMLFEEQQIYRQLLARSADNYTAAFRLLESSLIDQSLDSGWVLYKVLKKELNNNRTKYPQLLTSYISLLEAEGRLEKATKALEKHLEELRGATGSAKVSKSVLPVEMELCRLYIRQGEIEKCQRVIQGYPKEEKVSLSVRFLKNIVAGNGRINVGKLVEETMSAANSSGGVTSLFLAAQYSEQFLDIDGALAVIDRILQIESNSSRARIERARLLKMTGNLAESSKIYKEVTEKYPDNVYAKKTFLELEGRRGNYTEILERTDDLNGPDHKMMFSLIRARALWGEERQTEALDFYKKLLSPSVNSQFQEELAKYERSRREGDRPEKESFWEKFYYDLSNRLDNLNTLEEPDGFLSLLETAEGRLLADLYSAYRYEKIISTEYLARKAIEEKRYVAAEKQYRKSLEQDKSTEGLKDLAKIYERLGDYGKEAEVYSALAEQGASDTGTIESMERNRLTRAPTLSLDYSYLRKSGREEAIDLERKSGGTRFQFLPQISNSIELQYEELVYSSVDGPESLDGRMISARGWWKMSDSTLLDYGLGYHLLDSGFESTLVYNFRVEQKIKDQFQGYLEYSLDVEDDTVESLEEAIDVGTITGGFFVEAENGFVAGGELSRLSYSDDNSQDNLQLWASYSVYAEFTTITFQYSYEMLKSSVEGVLLTDTETGEKSYSLPYWSPDEYRQHLLTFRFHHLLKHFEQFEKDPSYYTLDLQAGFDSDENFIFNSSLDIFLEMSDNFLLKGKLHYLTTSDYEENRAALSLLYRW